MLEQLGLHYAGSRELANGMVGIRYSLVGGLWVVIGFVFGGLLGGGCLWPGSCGGALWGLGLLIGRHGLCGSCGLFSAGSRECLCDVGGVRRLGMGVFGW